LAKSLKLIANSPYWLTSHFSLLTSYFLPPSSCPEEPGMTLTRAWYDPGILFMPFFNMKMIFFKIKNKAFPGFRAAGKTGDCIFFHFYFLSISQYLF
jgi:hypothetical protein